jgi:hypothetical protein
MGGRNHPKGTEQLECSHPCRNHGDGRQRGVRRHRCGRTRADARLMGLGSPVIAWRRERLNAVGFPPCRFSRGRTSLLSARRTYLEKSPLVAQNCGRERPTIFSAWSRGKLGILVAIGTDEDPKHHQARSRPSEHCPIRITELLSRLDARHEIILSLANLAFKSLLIRGVQSKDCRQQI